MPKRRCSKCGMSKEVTEFNWRKKDLGWRQSVCRECLVAIRADHYQRHRQQEIKRSRRITAKARRRARDFVQEYLAYSVCVVCAEYDPAVLQFDHVRGEKRMEISRIVSDGYSLVAIQAEIAKCVVVCANCYQRRENVKRRSE